MQITAEQQAYDLGCEHARSAASWVVNGNTSAEHVERMIAMFDAGDPEVYDYLPREPDLSGEYADDLTPQSLYVEITGRDPYAETDGLAFETLHGQRMDAIADAYEEGVRDTFSSECARILREAL